MSIDASIDHIGPDLGGDYIFTVGGYKVPLLIGRLVDGENTWSLTFDGRFSIDCTDQDLQQWLWFFANACAVSAGYSHFGEGSQRRNPFTTQVGRIDAIDTDDEAQS